MATYFLFPSSGSAAVSPTVETDAANWDGHVNAVSRPMNLTNGASARTVLAYAPDAVDHLTDVDSMIAQFVSPVLPAQTIASQQLLFAASCLEANAANNLFLVWKVYAVSVDGTVDLGDLVALQRDDVEMAATQASRTDVATSTVFTSSVPFRLVCEVGAGGLPTAGGNHDFSVQFGEASTGFPQQAATGTAANTLLAFNGDIATVTQPSFTRRVTAVSDPLLAELFG